MILWKTKKLIKKKLIPVHFPSFWFKSYNFLFLVVEELLCLLGPYSAWSSPRKGPYSDLTRDSPWTLLGPYSALSWPRKGPYSDLTRPHFGWLVDNKITKIERNLQQNMQDFFKPSKTCWKCLGLVWGSLKWTKMSQKASKTNQNSPESPKRHIRRPESWKCQDREANPFQIPKVPSQPPKNGWEVLGPSLSAPSDHEKGRKAKSQDKKGEAITFYKEATNQKCKIFRQGSLVNLKWGPDWGDKSEVCHLTAW